MEKHIHNINDEKIKEVEMLEGQTIYDMALLFKMFSDPTRIKIMYALHEKSLNVCEISYLLNMTHSAISHQLATLKWQI
jgi:ArsR family transcriptional regulator